MRNPKLAHILVDFTDFPDWTKVKCFGLIFVSTFRFRKLLFWPIARQHRIMAPY